MQALKLAERTVQYADTLALLTEGNFRMARVHHHDGNTQLATKHYQLAVESQQKHTLSALGLSQMHIQSSEIAAAIHRLDGLTLPSTGSPCLEASIMLASLRTNPEPVASAGGPSAGQEDVDLNESDPLDTLEASPLLL